ncbi:MAG: Ig-like domain-containing protein [Nitrososphaerales archaeon]
MSKFEIVRSTSIVRCIATLSLTLLITLLFHYTYFTNAGPMVLTDQQDYAPGEIVEVTGLGFTQGISYDVVIIRPDGSIIKSDGTPGFDSVVAGPDGTFIYYYNLDGIFGTYIVEIYESTDISHSFILATTTFSDSPIHFFQHATSDKPTSRTSPSGFQIEGCAPISGAQLSISFDIYLLKTSGPAEKVRLTMQSDVDDDGQDESEYTDAVTINQIKYRHELGTTQGTEFTDNTSPFDVGGQTSDPNVPAAEEHAVGQLRAQTHPHTHVTVEFTTSGKAFYRVNGDNIDVPGAKSNFYFHFQFKADDPECVEELTTKVTTTMNFNALVTLSLSEKLTPTVTTKSTPTGLILAGTPVTDTAFVVGPEGEPAPTGTVIFFFCNPSEVTINGCESPAGTQVGTQISLVGSPPTATSHAVSGSTTPSNNLPGKYCWRAEYSGDDNYKPATFTNSSDECFTVEQQCLLTSPPIDTFSANMVSALSSSTRSGVDYVSMNTVVGSSSSGSAGIAKTVYAQKQIFDCLLEQGNIPYVKDVTIIAEIYEDMGTKKILRKHVEVISCIKLVNDARVLKCSKETPSQDPIVTNSCIEAPLSHPIKMNTVHKDGIVKTIEAQTEVFRCTFGNTDSTDDKKVDLIIFSEIWDDLNKLPSNPVIKKAYLFLRCVIKVNAGSVESCQFSGLNSF